METCLPSLPHRIRLQTPFCGPWLAQNEKLSIQRRAKFVYQLCGYLKIYNSEIVDSILMDLSKALPHDLLIAKWEIMALQ